MIVVNPQVFIMPTNSHTLPAVPAMPLLKQIPGVAITELKPEDHLQTRDPWRAYVGTPIKTQRSHNVHSGMTPQLQLERQQLTDFLAESEASMAPIPAPPMPQSDDPASVFKALLEGQAALLQGVNDIRANAVTRQQLQAFHKLQSTEMRTYVQAELVPIHRDLQSQAAHVDALSAEVSQLKMLKPKAEKAPDDSFKKLVVVGFPADMSLEARLSAMQDFMEANFPKLPASFCVKHTGPWKNHGQDRKMTRVGFIDVGCPDVRERVVQTIESKSLKIKIGGADIKVTRARTEAATARNTALRQASDLIKNESGVNDADVKIQWTGERGVTVSDVFAFKQPRGSDTGIFCGQYTHLMLG